MGIAFLGLLGVGAVEAGEYLGAFRAAAVSGDRTLPRPGLGLSKPTAKSTAPIAPTTAPPPITAGATQPRTISPGGGNTLTGQTYTLGTTSTEFPTVSDAAVQILSLHGMLITPATIKATAQAIQENDNLTEDPLSDVYTNPGEWAIPDGTQVRDPVGTPIFDQVARDLGVSFH